MIVLAFAMLTPGDRFPEIDAFDFQDKVIHLLCFSQLSYLWIGVGRKSKLEPWTLKNLILSILFIGIPSVGFEFAQLYIPNRSFDIYDLIVNQLGVLVGILAYFKTPTIPLRLH